MKDLYVASASVRPEPMKRSHRHVLVYLAARGDGEWTPGNRLPNGHGHRYGRLSASGTTLMEMRGIGWIEYGKEPKHSHYGYRITSAGRAALESSRLILADATNKKDLP